MTTRPTPAGLNTLRTVHQTLRGEVNNLAGQRGINSHTFRKLLADGFLSQVDPCPACAPEDVDVFAPGHPCERPLPGKHGNKCHGRMRMTAAAYEALGEPVPAKLHDAEQDIAQMHPEDVAGRARVVGAQLDQAAAAADADVKPAPIPAPAGAGEPAADLLDLLAEMLRAADVMTPAEVERSTGRVRNPEKCLSVPLALREPRFGALSPALVDALARREPADGPVYAVMAHVQSALVGPFASPAEARDWWAADFNKLAARARFVLVPARCVDCDDQAVTVGQPFHGTPEGRPGPKCGRHAGPARRLSGLPVPAADVECVDGPRLVDEINLRTIAASMGIPLPPAETVRVGALVVDEQAGTATPAPDADHVVDINSPQRVKAVARLARYYHHAGARNAIRDLALAVGVECRGGRIYPTHRPGNYLARGWDRLVDRLSYADSDIRWLAGRMADHGARTGATVTIEAALAAEIRAFRDVVPPAAPVTQAVTATPSLAALPDVDAYEAKQFAGYQADGPAGNPFPVVEVDPAEIAEEIEAFARYSARLREQEEGRDETSGEVLDVDAYEAAQQATRDRYWTEGCGADVLARDAELGAAVQLTLDVPAPADWRRPLTMAEAVDLFPVGADVLHLNPALADWRGVVEPMPRAGRHIEDHGNGPVVRVRWAGEPEVVGWYNAASIDPVPVDDDPDAGYDDPPLPPGFVPELNARVGIVVPLPATDDEVAAALARAASLPAVEAPPAPSGRRAARFLDETYQPAGRAVPST